MRVRLLHDVGNDKRGTVIDMGDHRAHRLIGLGYAVKDESTPQKKRKEPDANTVSHPRV